MTETSKLYLDFAKAQLKPYWDQMMHAGNPDYDTASSDAEFNRVLKAYGEYGQNGRFFHSSKHLLDLFEVFNTHRDEFENENHAIAFIFYHDIVYNTDARYSENEARSAKKCVEGLTNLGFGMNFIAPVERWIIASKTHKVDPEIDPQGALLMDMDMFSLSSPTLQYDENTLGVNAECGKLTEEKLQRRIEYFIDPAIKNGVYLTSSFKKYEAQAITNLKREKQQILNGDFLPTPQ